MTRIALSHEGWQREGVAAVLDSEDAQQEAVEHEQDDTPADDGNLLSSRVCHSGHLGGQADSAECKQGVWALIVSLE